MKFFGRNKTPGRRVRGAELVLIGTALVTSKFILSAIAPLVLSVFGLYRWLIRKRYGEGITCVATGALLWLLLTYSPLKIILWIPFFIGMLTALYGAILMILGNKENTEDSQDI